MPVVNSWFGRGVFAASFLGAAVLGTNVASADMYWAVLDAKSGRLLGQEGAETLHPPASLAKMMTLYLTFEAIRAGKLDWDDRIPVSRNASIKIPTKLWVKAGDTLSVREAVDGMIIISANDAATAIAEHFSGSEAAFAKRMTKRGKQLGLTNTVFGSPSGLTDKSRQRTTARDMALLGLMLQRDFPREFALFSQPSFMFRGKRLKGHNNVMYRYDGVDGIKTGYTAASGFNLVSSLTTPDKQLIAVVLGGKTARTRDAKMEALLTRFSTGGAATGSELMVMKAPLPTQKPERQLAAIDDEMIEQGDGDGSTVVATNASAWRIQIAALPSHTAATKLLGKAERHLRRVEPDAVGLIETTEGNTGRLFRVRFDGFQDARAARSACAALKQKKFDCITVQAE